LQVHRLNGAMPLIGHLDLVCGLDSLGQSTLLHQSFAAPIHISKPYREADTLLVNVVNPTAGLLSGDVIRCEAKVQSGAKLLLTSPSASRAHTMTSGEARMEQNYSVAAGGRLELWPEIFIPQKGARYRQSTTVHVEAGGELFFYESLAPGRVASGEVFEFDKLDWQTDIYLSGELVARERYTLSPGESGVDNIREQFPTGYYASCFLFSEKITSESSVWEALEQLHGASVWVGFSALRAGGWSVKMLAADSVALRSALQKLRATLYEALGEEMPSLRRV
jgi:urease accessory protein